MQDMTVTPIMDAEKHTLMQIVDRWTDGRQISLEHQKKVKATRSQCVLREYVMDNNYAKFDSSSNHCYRETYTQDACNGAPRPLLLQYKETVSVHEAGVTRTAPKSEIVCCTCN